MKHFFKLFLGRYVKNFIKKIFKDPYIIYPLIFGLPSRMFNRQRRKWVNVIDEEWDYLILLDACRFDTFAKLNYLEGDLNKKIAPGSCTIEWARANFIDYYEDIIYVSSNPYISNAEYNNFNGSKHFFKMISVWKDSWDYETGTIHPDKMVEASTKALTKYPHKRMIIHFLQPHNPYIGETKIIIEEPEAEKNKKDFNDKFDNTHKFFMLNLWKMVRKGQMPIETVIKAYEDNLILVLKSIEKFIEHLSGRIVITADHGECFGEKYLYGHPCWVRTKELLEIPWFVIDKGEKKKLDKQEIEKERLRTKIANLKKKGKI